MLWFGLGELRMPACRFPSPWSVEKTDACFIVRDGNGQALSYASIAKMNPADVPRPSSSSAMKLGGSRQTEVA